LAQAILPQVRAQESHLWRWLASMAETRQSKLDELSEIEQQIKQLEEKRDNVKSELGGLAEAATGNADEKPVIVSHTKLKTILKGILSHSESDETEQELVSDHLVEANLLGHHSHGVHLLYGYMRARETGRLKANMHVRTVKEEGPFLVLDGHNGYGQVMAHEATNMLISNAKKHGIAVVALRQAHHIGRMGKYGEMCAAQGLIGIFHANVFGHPPIVAPFGGAKGVCGTNPYCCGIPLGDDKAPIVLDFATSALALGKIQYFRDQGKSLPPGVALDKLGRPCTEPAGVHDGGCLLPIGLHKGSGLMLVNELLAGALTGGGTIHPGNPGATDTCKKLHPHDGTPTNSMFAIAIDPDRLAGNDYFRSDASAFAEHFKRTPACEESSPVLLPGELEQMTRKEHETKGISLPRGVWDHLIQLPGSGLAESEVNEIAK